MTVCPGTTPEKKHEILHAFYCAELKKLVPELLDKWQPVLGVMVSAWGKQNNIEARRIWLNLELAKNPVQCLEYVLVHELAHLLERHGLLNQHLPQSRTLREELNGSVLDEF